jgi:regulator of nucleoside diphosphate kinase
MTNVLITKLDYFRLKESLHRVKATNQENVTQANALLRNVHQATLVDSAEIPPDVITMNSLVRIVYLSTGRIMVLRLVYPEQADIKQNKISILAPLAMALLGSKKGDIINLKLPKGIVSIKVDTLLYQPEAAGNFQL